MAIRNYNKTVIVKFTPPLKFRSPAFLTQIETALEKLKVLPRQNAKPIRMLIHFNRWLEMREPGYSSAAAHFLH